MATVTHKVVRGDTLSALAKKYGTTVNAIAKLNNIKNVNLIYVGQVLTISGGSSPSNKNNTTITNTNNQNTTSSNQVTMKAFGLQADTDNTLFAIWHWKKENTDKFEVQWEYKTKDGNWFTGSHTTVDYASAVQDGYLFDVTYNVPSNAVTVRFRVKPISKTYTKDEKTVSYWTAVWTGYKTYDTRSINAEKPPTPNPPTVEVKDYTLTCKVDNLMNVDWVYGQEYVEFNIIRNDTNGVYLGLSRVVYYSASYSCAIDPGYEYKVRARIKNGNMYGDWSNYSTTVSCKPSKPIGGCQCYATSSTSVLVKWNSVQSATSYELQYATNKDYFDGSNGTTSITVDMNHQYQVTGLESGERYFFRVRAVNEKGRSDWTGLVSVIIGTKPIAPTTWSSTTTVITGEDLILYWIHNSEDASAERMAEVEVYYDSQMITHTVINDEIDDDNPQKTSRFVISTSGMTEGKSIKWRVRTAGITNEFGDWSVQRTVDVYAKPSLSLLLFDNNGNTTTDLTAFPFRVTGEAGPATQTPVSYHLSIIAGDNYETVDEIGNFKMVMAGDYVFSRFYDTSEKLDVTLYPQDVDLQPGVPYDLVCVVGMDSGLTAESVISFGVNWIDNFFVPNAQITFDPEKIITHINPFCEYYPYIYYKVNYENGVWVRTDTEIEELEGISVDNALTETYEDIVYAGYLNNIITHFCVVLSEEPRLVPDITLSVYRREFDGSFTEVGNNLSNESNTFVTDPHPPLDYARYRIVATSDKTGAIYFTDLPAYPIQVKSIVMQWNEAWTDYDLPENEAIAKPAWHGSMLKLPYNIDVSESNSLDVSLINYIGRKHPVSYYGTHVGSTAIWHCAVPKRDKETIYALRRLAIWMGDVYVREPSGAGYWANVSVSLNQNHCELVVPVTIDITRVTGGV
jgi:hypothetical protein